jgi:hypothetical protein
MARKDARTYRLRAILSLSSFAFAIGSAYAALPDARNLSERVKPGPSLPSRSTEAPPQEQARPALKLDSGVKITVKRIHRQFRLRRRQAPAAHQ